MQDDLNFPACSFPIGELSRKTGVNSVTLRAWERRYGLLRPQRTEKGHRLYGEQDVECVQQILLLMKRGVPLRKIRPLLAGQVALPPAQHNEDALDWQQQCRGWLEQLDRAALERGLQQLCKQYPPDWCRQQVIEPLFGWLLDHPARAALDALLQAGLMRYVLRYPPANKACLLVMASEQTAPWRAAWLALEQDGCWLPGAFSLTALQHWLHLQPAQAVLYCLDGVLNAAHTVQLQQLLHAHPGLRVQGTAAELAFAGHEQVVRAML